MLNLDFGDVSSSSFGTSGNLEIIYSNVSAGIDARLVASSTFFANPNIPTASGNNGSLNGDIRIQLGIDSSLGIQTVQFELFLLNSIDGSAFDASGSAFSLLFFDIDGTSAAFDQLEFEDAENVVFSDNSTLGLTEDLANNTVTVSGETSGEVATGGNVTENNFSLAQQDVSALVTVTGENSVSFSYTVDGTSSGNGRNLLIDGSGLIAFDVVPEPSSSLLVLFGFGAMLLKRKR